MKKINIFLTFIFVSFYSYTFSQQFDNSRFLSREVDKIVLSTVNFKDKTTETPIYKQDSITKLNYPINENVKESITQTGIANLSKVEQEKVILLLKNLKKVHALPYQYDIQLDFYKKNKIVQTITISSETKNIVINKKGCEVHTNKYGEEINPCIFKGMVSSDLKKYIVSLLKNKKLWNKDQQFLEDYK